MSDEPTAIRWDPNVVRSTTWHRKGDGFLHHTQCSLFIGSMTERVPVSSVPTTDLCKTCWPTTKEQNA